MIRIVPVENKPDLPSPPNPPQNVPVASFQLSSPNVTEGVWPSRGLLYSFLIHELALFGILFLSLSSRLAELSRPPKPVEMVKLSEPREVVYLPNLGGGGGGGAKKGPPSNGPGAPRKGSSTASAQRSSGFSFSGPQPILSNPPNPTNRLQTILQPALENPPVLKAPVILPNMVLLADAGPVPQFEPPPPPKLVIKPPSPKPEEPPPLPAPVKPAVKAPEPVVPTLQLKAQAPLEMPKLVIATTESQNPPPPPEPKPPEPAAKPVVKPPEPPKPEHFSSVPSRGPDLQNLLTLSPMPAHPQPSVTVPAGEERGRFAISPEPNLTASRDEPPGLKLDSPSSQAIGIGKQTGDTSGNAAAENTAAGAAGGRDLPNGAGGGAGAGAGKANGSGSGGSGPGGDGSGGKPGAGRGGGTGSGNGTGAGPGSGTGTGSGSGSGAGSGRGAGAGPGSGSFPGITIQGGRLEGGTAGESAGKSSANAASPAAPQQSYSLTIVSTGNSGGGMADFGVFSHEQVYTVYIEMKRTIEDRAPSWTLQYSALRGAAARESAAESSSRSQGWLEAPFPAVKELPQLPAELVHKYLNRLIVVYAIINPEGKLEQMLVKQSPDTQLQKPLFEALSKWVFRPAELNGEPVPVKVLLGIPLWEAE